MTEVLSIWKGLVAIKPYKRKARDVLEDVAAEHGISVAVLTGGSRIKKIAYARFQAAYEIRQLGFSYPNVARFVGHEDHTSTIHAVKRWAEYLANGGQMPKHKRRQTPKQIAANLPATKRIAEAKRAAPGPNLKALEGDPGETVEIRKIGRELFARRSSWMDRLLSKGSEEWTAVNRLSDLFAQRLGHDDRMSGGISSGSRSLVSDRMLEAAETIDDVFRHIGAQDRSLLTELISPKSVITCPDVDRWRLVVAMVTGIRQRDAQSAVVKMAAQNLAAAMVTYDYKQGVRAA